MHTLLKTPVIQQLHSLTRPSPTEGPCYQETLNPVIQLLLAVKQPPPQTVMIFYKGKSTEALYLEEKLNVLSMQGNISLVSQRDDQGNWLARTTLILFLM